MNLAACQAACDQDSTCNAIEINGCNANPETCGGPCWLFNIVGAITNGGCITDGDQKGYRRGSSPCQASTSDTNSGTPAVTCSGSCGCCSSSGQSSGTITDGSGDYSNGEDCRWLISSPNEIRLSFASFNTESCCDYVTINRCSSSSCSSPEQIARLSGTSVSSEYTSSTGYLQVLFTSDSSVQGSGFEATWQVAPPRRGGGRDARVRKDWASRETLKPGGVMRHLLSTRLNQLPPLVEQNQALAASREARARVTRVGSTASAARDQNDTAVQLHLHAQSVCGTREFFSPVAAGNNTAQYGPCIASGYHRLGLQGMPTRQAPGQAGVMLNIYVVKLDQYEQIMTGDSSSSLQVYSALEGTKINDNSVTFIGNIISVFREGQAVFSIGIKPTFSGVYPADGRTELLRPPYLYFKGTDLTTAAVIMETDPQQVHLDSGNRIACPVGSVLLLEPAIGSGQVSLTDPRPGACKVCDPGLYNVNPLTGRCLACPSSATCRNGAPPLFGAQKVAGTVEMTLPDGGDGEVLQALADKLGVEAWQLSVSVTDVVPQQQRRHSTRAGGNGEEEWEREDETTTRAVGKDHMQSVLDELLRVEKHENEPEAEGKDERKGGDEAEMRGAGPTTLATAQTRRTVTVSFELVADEAQMAKLAASLPALGVKLGEIKSIGQQAAAGEVWEEVNGVFMLRKCPPGFKLISEPIESQKCLPCGKGKYIIEGSTDCVDCPVFSPPRPFPRVYIAFVPPPHLLAVSLSPRTEPTAPTAPNSSPKSWARCG